MEDKKQFVEDLSKAIAPHLFDIGVMQLTYHKPGKLYPEEVLIYYINGYEEVINVTYDSPLGILKDICKQGFKY